MPDMDGYGEEQDFLYDTGDKVVLVNLVDHQEYNGTAAIVASRKQTYASKHCPSGCAYYLDGGLPWSDNGFISQERLAPQDNKGETLAEAKKAADAIKYLQSLYWPTDERGFNVTSAYMRYPPHNPSIHLPYNVLDQISKREDWSWTARDGDCYPFRAHVILFGVEFFDLFTRDEAVEYNCPLIQDEKQVE